MWYTPISGAYGVTVSTGVCGAPSSGSNPDRHPANSLISATFECFSHRTVSERWVGACVAGSGYCAACAVRFWRATEQTAQFVFCRFQSAFALGRRFRPPPVDVENQY